MYSEHPHDSPFDGAMKALVALVAGMALIGAAVTVLPKKRSEAVVQKNIGRCAGMMRVKKGLFVVGLALVIVGSVLGVGCSLGFVVR